MAQGDKISANPTSATSTGSRQLPLMEGGAVETFQRRSSAPIPFCLYG